MALIVESNDLETAIESRGLLRVCTAGSVDDGKSTLIGRLLYDSRSIADDQYDAVRQLSGGLDLDLSLLTDGLRAEREQKITIDVAYRHLASPRRRFILADTPGHAQYTRNMVTGASTADLAIILVDARKGLLSQSKRHALIASLLRVPHVLLAVNKMDLVGFDESVFREIETEFRRFKLGFEGQSVTAIPISAVNGDNVAFPSSRMPWYGGPTVIEHLESVPSQESTQSAFRFPVQAVVRLDAIFRGYAGRVASGDISVGDTVTILPGRNSTRVRSIVTADGEISSASAGDSVILVLDDEIDVSRGDLIAGPFDQPEPADRLEASLCWLGDAPSVAGKRYTLLHGSRQVGAVLNDPFWVRDVETFEVRPADAFGINDIGGTIVECLQPVFVDDYASNRAMGGLLLVDPQTNLPAAAIMVSSILRA